MLQAALQSPAVYELLPPLDFPFTQPPPQLVLWLKHEIPQDTSSLASSSSSSPSSPFQQALPAASHRSYTIHTPPAAAPAPGAPPVHLQAAPQISRCAPESSSSSSNTASSPFSNQAHEYVFQHDHLPGLLAHLLMDNTGEAKPASQLRHCLP